MRKVLLAILVAAGAVEVMAESAHAFHHTIRARCIAYYPGLYSYGYCGGPPSPPPPYTFPCSFSYPKYCGPWASCYDGRVTCSTGGRGHGCRLGLGGCHARKAAHRAGYGGRGCGGYGGCGYGGYCGGFGGCLSNGWSVCGNAACGYGYSCGNGCGDSCGGSCGDGCNGGGCGAGGCDGCSSGVSSGSVSAGAPIDSGSSAPYQSGDERVLYDGPAENAPSINNGAPAAPAAPPTPQADPSTGIIRTPFQLTSAAERTGDGANEFNLGMRAYRDNNMSQALQAFEAAAAAEPQNALYAYFRALTMYNLHGAEAANDWLGQAVELERTTPVAGWGRRMERVQGRARIWVEQARAAAGINR